jgi:hypothetical protein
MLARIITMLVAIPLTAFVVAQSPFNEDLLKMAWEGQDALVESFLEMGADVDARDEFGQTPLMIAVSQGHFDTVRVLIEGGADVTATDTEGQRVLSFADDDEIVELLIEAGATYEVGTTFVALALLLASLILVLVGYLLYRWFSRPTESTEEDSQVVSGEHPRWTPKLPKMRIGYTIAIIGFVVGVIELAYANDPDILESEEPFIGYYLIFNLAGWFYWLYCVYKFHDAIERTPGYSHPITSSWAVAMHFVPLYNFYWVFKWPSKMAIFVNWRTQSQKMEGGIAGGLVLLAMLVTRFVDNSLGLICLFSAGVYISRRLSEAFAAPPVPESAMARAPKGILGL